MQQYLIRRVNHWNFTMQQDTAISILPRFKGITYNTNIQQFRNRRVNHGHVVQHDTAI